MPTSPTKKAAPKKAAAPRKKAAPKKANPTAGMSFDQANQWIDDQVNHGELLAKIKAGGDVSTAERAELDRMIIDAQLVNHAAILQQRDALTARFSGPKDYDEETLADGSVVIYPHADHKGSR